MPSIEHIVSPQAMVYLKKFLLTEWKQLDQIPSGLFYGLKVFLICLPVIYALERLTGQKTSHYRTRGFLNDVFFFIFVGCSGVLNLLFVIPAMIMGWSFTRLLHLHPVPFLENAPLVIRYLTLWIAWDFIGYWVHRLFHTSELLWPFHAMHHSPKVLTFTASLRVHPVEQVVHFTFKSIPTMLWGANPVIWFPLNFFLRSFLDNVQHSEIPWRYGPLYRVFVGPAFHSFHHSTDPRHFNKNFSINFAFWDFLFGTAVDEPERNRTYGLAEVHWETVTSLLLGPFPMLWEVLRKRRTAGAANLPIAGTTTARQAIE